MRIGIVTFPVDRSTNYGCVMQNYALQRVIQKLGHAPKTLRLADIIPTKSQSLLEKIHISKKTKGIPNVTTPLTSFCEKFISFTDTLYLPVKPGKLSHENFDAYIAGSDQIWRPSLTHHHFLKYAMLDFTASINVTRIAYAISFGQATWSLPRKILFYRLRKLISRFAAISMREEEGQEYSKKYLKITAPQQVMDPTLLLTQDDYMPLTTGVTAENHLVSYILDDTPEKKSAIDRLFLNGHFTGRCDFTIKKTAEKRQPTMEDWLTAFKTAKLIVTDSYHGTAFAILFRRPFITIANNSRGLARFFSLLEKLNLTDCLVSSPNDISSDVLNKHLDFDAVHKRLEVEREKSLLFLSQALAKKT
ncbi:MAG: polysaccharide pyruvyl transferase family protein [Paludibacter sp.]|nr:polysaccharide pyruvyl transferase family protein [Paludibacter sp.]MDD4429476.1 polysaccharide pyruvyl transferase family protein [Paludibacter sp.]